MTAEDEAIYARVAEEIAAGFVRPGLWTMALARAGYDETSAKALYIELRAQTLQKELEEAIGVPTVSTALDRISRHLDHHQARLVEEARKQRQSDEDAKLEKWKRGIAAARKYLENPIPIELYREKYQITESAIHAKVSQGSLRAYRTEGEYYIDDPAESERDLMEKLHIHFDGRHFIYRTYRYDRLADAIAFAKNDPET